MSRAPIQTRPPRGVEADGAGVQGGGVGDLGARTGGLLGQVVRPAGGGQGGAAVDDQPGNVAGAEAVGMTAVWFDVTRPADSFTAVLATLLGAGEPSR